MNLSLMRNDADCERELLNLNDVTRKYSLELSQSDIKTLVEARNDALTDTGLVEFGFGVMGKLVYALCDSPFVQKDDYCETLRDMLSLFYHFRAKYALSLTDDEIIKRMIERFNTVCEGSVEFLSDMGLGKAEL